MDVHPIYDSTCSVPAPHAHDMFPLKYWLWLGSLSVLQLGLIYLALGTLLNVDFICT